MPIYEYYCSDCHTLFNFFTPSPSSRSRPSCPRCSRPRLERRPSRFAFVTGSSGDSDDDELFEGMDEERLEGAMESLAGEMERMGDTEDPRAVGRLLRRFGEMTDLELGPKMEDALRRMEAGEDLDEIDAGMEGDEDDLEDLFRFKRKVLRRAQRPQIDDTLYFL